MVPTVVFPPSTANKNKLVNIILCLLTTSKMNIHTYILLFKVS